MYKFIYLFALLSFAACNEKEPTSAQCDRALIVSDTNYKNAKDESDFRIKDVSIAGNCMKITYSYGGGCGKIETELVASENHINNTMELPTRKLKLSIDDKDNCEALITTTEEFDISALQNSNGSNTTIELYKWDSLIQYSY